MEFGMTEWRRIADFPDYEVSDDGQVRSWRPYANCTMPPAIPKLMVGFVCELGYHSVILRKPSDTKPHRRLVHRLVAEAFIANRENLSDVAHREGVAAGNHVANLRWSTHRDNQMDMRRHGTMQDGEKCVTAKLTAEQVELIKACREVFGKGVQYRIASFFNISKAQVSRIINGRRWASTYGVKNG